MANEAIKLFFSYSHRDEELRNELERHLSGLRRQGVIQTWHDRRIGAGMEWANQIDKNLEQADIILLLVSANFLDSDYCWSVELTQAIRRHESGEARVLPIILRSVDWSGAPFARLQALPRNAKPITSWRNWDEAFTDVAQGIRAAVQELQEARYSLKSTGIDSDVSSIRSIANKPNAPYDTADPVHHLQSWAVNSLPVTHTPLDVNDLPSDCGMNYTPLRNFLEAGQWKQADQETFKLMLKITRQEERGTILEPDIMAFPCRDLQTIDQLWSHYSQGKFGFTAQKRIWKSLGRGISWRNFTQALGWRDDRNEIRGADDFTYDLSAPDGHLPIALRWIQRISFFARMDRCDL